jgi:DNA topoisomerase-1
MNNNYYHYYYITSIIKNNNEYYISFVGKSKIHHEIRIPCEYLYFIKQYIISNKPNYPLFYYIIDNKIKNINSEELNVFLKENMGQAYTCKDFRTYSANILFIKEFLKISKLQKLISNTQIKKLILTCIDKSAQELGHSRSICRKSYISNHLIDYCVDSFSKASTESLTSLICKISS